MLRSAVRARLGSLYVFGGFSFFILFCTLASVFYGFLFWHSLCVVKAMLEIWRVKSDSKCRKDPEQEHCVTLTSSSIHSYFAHNCICDKCLFNRDGDRRNETSTKHALPGIEGQASVVRIRSNFA